MKLRPAEEIIGFLSFSRRDDRLPDFQAWSRKRWAQTLQWLDDTGLAFYFLQGLTNRGKIDSLPAWVLERLETNFALNQQRTDFLWGRFKRINKCFAEAGISYVVLKGFSLVPQFCPSAALRHQGDVDYLIDGNDLSKAKRVLEAMGYTRKLQQSTHESVFLSPGDTAPSRSGRQYSASSPHAVELHLNVWDAPRYGVLDLPRLFSPANARTTGLHGEEFPSLSDEDAFLLQVVHACHHIFTQWIRMSCLFEIGYFLTSRADDSALWNKVDERIGMCSALREFVVIVSEMAASLFGCPVPSLIRAWSLNLRPIPRLWLDRYSMKWIFSGIPAYEMTVFPKSKLVLFLQTQYRKSKADEQLRPEPRPQSRISRMFSAARENPALLLNRDWWSRQRILQRTVYYNLAVVRYLVECPRWHWRLRNARGSTQTDIPISPEISELPNQKSA